MNTIKVLNSSYLHFANRTIETLLIAGSKQLYLYNHQGQYFKIFNQKKELENYLSALPYKMVTEFYSEAELDKYLLSLNV